MLPENVCAPLSGTQHHLLPAAHDAAGGADQISNPCDVCRLRLYFYHSIAEEERTNLLLSLPAMPKSRCLSLRGLSKSAAMRECTLMI